MDDLLSLGGETHVIPIIGDPIAQVKSPAGVTRALNAKGRNSVVVPIHVEGFVAGARLQSRQGKHVRAGSDDPTGFTLVVNATPTGIARPIQSGASAKLDAHMFVGDVITAPAVTPLIEAARRAGCAAQVGGGMFAEVLKLMVAFLLARDGELAGR